MHYDALTFDTQTGETNSFHFDGGLLQQLKQFKDGPVRMVVLSIFGALALVTPAARAQTYDPKYPVCLQVYDDMVNFYFECGYTSMAQCAASASGRYAQCVVNPYYAGPTARRGARQKRAR